MKNSIFLILIILLLAGCATKARHKEDATEAIKPDLLAALQAADADVSEIFARFEKSSNDPDAFKQSALSYKRALDQGLMTPGDLQLRLATITREHINKNPSKAGEMMQAQQRILELAGVQRKKRHKRNYEFKSWDEDVIHCRRNLDLSLRCDVPFYPNYKPVRSW
ncbi:hypothetical protein [Nitrosomonas sp. Nm58]|uniref:hypothetical protein n=1 Tax=Nitrosomonas sp. Nm58 TaxID=200126 RepID=UPI000B88C325|nr:hypothetical protein [Nitrosomonas sp. Nm58]